MAKIKFGTDCWQFVIVAMAALSLTACGPSPASRLETSLKELSAAKSNNERFYALDEAAKASFELGNVTDARRFATELLTLAPKFPKDWNYGNAIHDGNMVLGRIAVREGRIEEGKKLLLEAGKAPGSPQLDSFGPNMSLAKDLLQKGERATVLEYFKQCGVFWKAHHDVLDKWSQDVNDGRIPDFGANLLY